MRHCGAYQKRISLLRQFSACPPGPAFPSLSLVAAICLLASPTARSATRRSVPRLFVALALPSRGATAASEGRRAGQQGTASESWTRTYPWMAFYMGSTESAEPKKTRHAFRKQRKRRGRTGAGQVLSGCFPVLPTTTSFAVPAVPCLCLSLRHSTFT